MKKVFLAGVAALSVLGASAAQAAEPMVRMPPLVPGTYTLRPGPGTTFVYLWGKVTCKDVKFTVWISWDFRTGEWGRWQFFDADAHITGKSTNAPISGKFTIEPEGFLLNDERCQIEEVAGGIMKAVRP